MIAGSVYLLLRKETNTIDFKSARSRNTSIFTIRVGCDEVAFLRCVRVLNGLRKVQTFMQHIVESDLALLYHYRPTMMSFVGLSNSHEVDAVVNSAVTHLLMYYVHLIISVNGTYKHRRRNNAKALRRDACFKRAKSHARGWCTEKNHSHMIFAVNAVK